MSIVKPGSSQFPQGSGRIVSRPSHYPDYAERAHAVCAERGANAVESRPEAIRPPEASPMLTGAPNKVRGRSASPASEQRRRVYTGNTLSIPRCAPGTLFF
jgi:hypothetical protein